MRELFGDLLARIPVLESLPFGDADRLTEMAGTHFGELDAGLLESGVLDQGLDGILPAEAPVDDLIDLLPIR